MNVPMWLCRAWMCWLLAIQVVSAQPASEGTPTRFQFHIPAQALNTALEKYSEITKRSLLYDSSLAAGLRSREVRGLMTADVALVMMLEESGLQVRYVEQDAFAIVQDSAEDTDASSKKTLDAGERHFYGMVQRKIREAFCRQPDTMPGKYRTLLRFWIGSDGTMEKAEIVSSTGDSRLDGLLLDAMLQLRIGHAPPAGMVQPFTLLILPKQAARTGDCS